MLGRFSFPSVHNLEAKSPFRMLLSEGVRSSGVPAILLTSPHMRRDGSSQPFPKPDSRLQKLLTARSGEIWWGLVLPLLLLLLLFSFSSPFSALSSFLFPFPLFCSQPAIFTSSSSFPLQDCLSHMPTLQLASPAQALWGPETPPVMSGGMDRKEKHTMHWTKGAD